MYALLPALYTQGISWLILYLRKFTVEHFDVKIIAVKYLSSVVSDKNLIKYFKVEILLLCNN